MSEKEIVDFLAKRRLSLGLSTRALAARMGCTHTTVNNYENHKYTPTLTLFLAWLRALNIEIDHKLVGAPTHFQLLVRVKG